MLLVAGTPVWLAPPTVPVPVPVEPVSVAIELVPVPVTIVDGLVVPLFVFVAVGAAVDMPEADPVPDGD